MAENSVVEIKQARWGLAVGRMWMSWTWTCWIGGHVGHLGGKVLNTVGGWGIATWKSCLLLQTLFQSLLTWNVLILSKLPETLGGNGLWLLRAPSPLTPPGWKWVRCFCFHKNFMWADHGLCLRGAGLIPSTLMFNFCCVLCSHMVTYPLVCDVRRKKIGNTPCTSVLFLWNPISRPLLHKLRQCQGAQALLT